MGMAAVANEGQLKSYFSHHFLNELIKCPNLDFSSVSCEVDSTHRSRLPDDSLKRVVTDTHSGFTFTSFHEECLISDLNQRKK